jgi:hypothetical protein
MGAESIRWPVITWSRSNPSGSSREGNSDFKTIWIAPQLNVIDPLDPDLLLDEIIDVGTISRSL